MRGAPINGWNGCLTGTLPAGFPWPTVSAFLRLVTSPRIFERLARFPGLRWHNPLREPAGARTK